MLNKTKNISNNMEPNVMNESPICKYRNVSERDMDLLFIEAFATDSDFLSLFVNKTDIQNQTFRLVHAERSKIDHGLGESDITLVIDVDGDRKAFLIENKIDAVAMPEQHERYIKRGKSGIQNGIYNQFYVFIVCPEQYRKNNQEGAKYEYFVSYEECRDLFKSKPDIYSNLRYQQICQALETVKPEYKVDINEIAVDSFQKYSDYQKAYYPRLKLINKIDTKQVNGWWPQFSVGTNELRIYHKTNFDCVDLTINGKADKIAELRIIEKWLHDCGHTNITLVKTGKSAAFRIMTPPIKMYKPFGTWKIEDLNECFKSIQELSDLASMFAIINHILFS